MRYGEAPFREWRLESVSPDEGGKENRERIEKATKRLGIALAALWRSVREASPKPEQALYERAAYFQLADRQGHFITVDAFDVQPSDPGPDSLLRFFHLFLTQSNDRPTITWIVNEVLDEEGDLKYQPFFYDFNAQRKEMDADGYVPAGLLTIDDPTAEEIEKAAALAERCLASRNSTADDNSTVFRKRLTNTPVHGVVSVLK